VPPRTEDVGRLEIAVDDVLLVRVRQSVRHVPQQGQRVGDGARPGPPDALGEGLSLDVRHDVVEEAVGPPGVDEGEDVRVREARGEPDLLEEALLAVQRRDLGTKHLEHDAAVVLPLPGKEDDGHPALPQRVDDAVPFGERLREARSELRTRHGGRGPFGRAVQHTVGVVAPEKGPDLLDECFVRPGLLPDRALPCLALQLDHVGEDLEGARRAVGLFRPVVQPSGPAVAAPLPARLRGHAPSASPPPVSSRWSQARAFAQSRETVRRATSSTSAISSSVIPPK